MQRSAPASVRVDEIVVGLFDSIAHKEELGPLGLILMAGCEECATLMLFKWTHLCRHDSFSLRKVCRRA